MSSGVLCYTMLIECNTSYNVLGGRDLLHVSETCDSFLLNLVSFLASFMIFRTFLCKKKILVSADFYFHRREEFCIPTLPIGKCNPLYWGKPVHSFFFPLFCKKNVTGTAGCMEKWQNFPLYRIILSSHKHTLRVWVLSFIMVENRNLFIYLSLQ